MSLLTIQQRVLQRLDEDSSNPAYYPALEVKAAINEGQRVFALLTLCLQTTATQALAAATSTYRMLELYPDWLLPLRVRVHGVGGAKLAPASLGELQALNPAWLNEAGTPQRYAAVGFDFVAIGPRPAATGTSLDWTYARCPNVMTADADVPEIPPEYHMSLADYAIPALRAKEGGREFLNSLRYFDRFLEAADKMASFIRARNKSLDYDRGPFELSAFDRSRLVGKETKGKREWQTT